MRNALLVVSIAAGSVSGMARADIVTQWNFNSIAADGMSDTGSLIPSIGAGSVWVVTGGSAEDPDTTAVDNTFVSAETGGGSSEAPLTDNTAWQRRSFATQGNGDKTEGVQFNVSTVGFESISLSWDQYNSNEAARHLQVQYTTNGSMWNDLAGLITLNQGLEFFNGQSVSFSAISAADNNANFGVRFLATFAPSTTAYTPTEGITYSSTGGWRFDMVTVNGAPIAVPEASAFLLGGAVCGVLGLTLAGRRLCRD